MKIKHGPSKKKKKKLRVGFVTLH